MRFTLYVLTFIATSILFLLFNWIYLADSFVLATFLISTFYFIFTKETKVTDPEVLKIPQINQYHADRNSSYVYIMAVVVIVGGIIFWLLSPYVRSGLLLLPIWLMIITASYLAVKRQEKFNVRSELLNYLFFTLGEEYPVVKRYYTSVTAIMQKELKEKDVEGSLLKINKQLGMFLKKFDVPEDRVSYYITQFMKSRTNPELLSDEVKSFNSEN